jgi:hypothetical protein
MASLHWLKFGGTCLHWPEPFDKSDISLKTEMLLPVVEGLDGGPISVHEFSRFSFSVATFWP